MPMKLQPHRAFLGLLEFAGLRRVSRRQSSTTSHRLSPLWGHIEGADLRANPGPRLKCPKMREFRGLEAGFRLNLGPDV